jgi:hypothetical protein
MTAKPIAIAMNTTSSTVPASFRAAIARLLAVWMSVSSVAILTRSASKFAFPAMMSGLATGLPLRRT